MRVRPGNQPIPSTGKSGIAPMRTLHKEVVPPFPKGDQTPSGNRSVFEHFFNSLDEAILLTDGQGVILAINPAASRLLADGAGGSKFHAGLAMENCLDPAAGRSMITALRELSEGKPAVKCDFSSIANQGQRQSARIRSLGGSPDGPRTLCWNLEQPGFRVGGDGLTDGDPQSALERKIAALQSASEAKDQFLAVLSHELRTPLTAVLGAASEMESAQLPADVRQTVEMIRRNAELEARLIDDLLDLSRVNTGKLRLTRQTIDAHAALHGALDICHSELNAKQLNVELDLRAADHHVSADSARLQQVFWNLLKNTVKFTPAGGRIILRTQNTDQQALRIQIQDNGRGIEPEMLPRIFDAFQQGSAPANHGSGGLGLGLTISRMLIEAHEGTIFAASDGVGSGTAFTIDLDTVPAPPVMTELASVVLPNSPPRRIRWILLVEDHHDTALILRRLLEGHDYQVRIADSVHGALAAAGEQPFDLLISDIGLPDGSGLELMRSLQKIQPIKGVALTGFGRDDDVQNSRDAGFYAHITKPVNFKRLQAVIREAEL